MAVPAGSVWLDAQAAQGEGSAERGLGRHVVEVVKALDAISPETLGSVRLDPGLPEPEALRWLADDGRLGWGLGRPRAGEPVPSIYHVPAPFEVVPIDRIWPEWVRSGQYPVRTVVTLHDLVQLAMPEEYLQHSLALKTLYSARLGLIRHADQILAISESTAADAVEHLGVDPRRITMIGSGTSDTFSSLVSSDEKAGEILRSAYPRVRDGFILYVGGGDPRKNMEGAIDGFARLPTSTRDAHQLVVVSKLGPQASGELRVHARRLGVDDADLFFTGFVPDTELAAMYRRCSLFYFPSLYEGFGLPILEAMSCGAPVAAGNNSSIPEVLGDLRGTFDASDPNHIAATVGRLLADPEELLLLRERSRRRAAHFTWERTAEKVLEGYEVALSRPAPGEGFRRTRKRVAVVTPWPPERSLAASSSERLVSALTEHADVDVIVSGGEQGFDRTPRPGVRFWGIDELDWLCELRDHDGHVYALDGAPGNAEALAALIRRPGVVLLHDIGLAPIYEARADKRRWVDRAERTALLERAAHPTREVQAHATAIIVRSREQLEALERERRANAAPALLVPAEDDAGLAERLIELLELS
jgi:glycosyltransferase involved in cell wall biosynthesis